MDCSRDNAAKDYKPQNRLAGKRLRGLFLAILFTLPVLGECGILPKIDQDPNSRTKNAYTESIPSADPSSTGILIILLEHRRKKSLRDLLKMRCRTESILCDGWRNCQNPHKSARVAAGKETKPNRVKCDER